MGEMETYIKWTLDNGQEYFIEHRFCDSVYISWNITFTNPFILSQWVEDNIKILFYFSELL